VCLNTLRTREATHAREHSTTRDNAGVESFATNCPKDAF
jgi:hypothetical protein